LGWKIEPAPDEWDRTYGVDFYIKIKDKFIGIQIKPISSGQSINQYQWVEMHRKNHERFKNDFGGNVFFVNTIKGAGKKKGIKNFFWVSVAGKDILYGKSRFSLKFGESSFDCLSFRSLL